MRKRFNVCSAALESARQQLGIHVLDDTSTTLLINHLKEQLITEAQQVGLIVKCVRISKQGGGWYTLSVVEK